MATMKFFTESQYGAVATWEDESPAKPAEVQAAPEYGYELELALEVVSEPKAGYSCPGEQAAVLFGKFECAKPAKVFS